MRELGYTEGKDLTFSANHVGGRLTRSTAGAGSRAGSGMEVDVLFAPSLGRDGGLFGGDQNRAYRI